MPLLAGFHDEDLHNNVVEALKVLGSVQEEYARRLRSIDTQYLKTLEASNDGDSEACLQAKAQIAAVRAKF